MTAKSRSLSPQRTPVKYSNDVPPVSIMPVSEFSRIKRRAFSMRPRRSSAEMGVASSLMDSRLAIESARFSSVVAARPLVQAVPAAARDEVARNSRRDSMIGSVVWKCLIRTENKAPLASAARDGGIARLANGLLPGAQALPLLLLLNQPFGELQPFLEIQHAVVHLMQEIEVGVVQTGCRHATRQPVGQGLSDRAFDDDHHH